MLDPLRLAWRTFSPDGDRSDILVAIAIALGGGAAVLFAIDLVLTLEPVR